jgi:hypothetical protein
LLGPVPLEYSFILEHSRHQKHRDTIVLSQRLVMRRLYSRSSRDEQMQDGTGWSEISQIVPLQSVVKYVLTKLHGNLLGGHLCGFRQGGTLMVVAGNTSATWPVLAPEPGTRI